MTKNKVFNILQRIIIDLFFVTLISFFMMCIAIDDFPKSIFTSKKNDIIYVIKENDDLRRIAGKYNISIIDIAIANNLRTIVDLNPGQKLILPYNVKEQDRNLYLAEYQGMIYDARVNIRNMEFQLEDLTDKTNKLQNNINKMAMKLKSQNYAVPLDTINEHEDKVKEYNDLVIKYKAEYKKYTDKLSEFNTLLKHYNSIVGKDNN